MSKKTIIWEISLLMFIFLGVSAFIGSALQQLLNVNYGYLLGIFLTFPYLYFLPKTEVPFELQIPGDEK